MMCSLLSHEVIIWYMSQRVKSHWKDLNIKLRSVQERALQQIINVYHATSTEILQIEINTALINIYLWKLTQKSIMNMNFWKSDEVIKMMMHRICNDLILKRDWKSKLHKTFLQLKQKWMKETLEQMKMKWNHLYMMILWSESSRVIIVTNKKMLINQHCLNTFALKQRVYSNNSDSRKNVTMTAIKINWKLNKRLKELILIIIHHEELKELIARMKHLADVMTENQEYHKKYTKYTMIVRLLWKQWKLWYQQKIRHVCNEFRLHMRTFDLKKSHWSYIEWRDMQKYLKMKQWTKWLMMYMSCLYCWLSINALKWWQDWYSYRNKSNKHEE